MKQFNIVIEKHSDGYVVYPIGVVREIVGQGNTYEEACADVKSAIASTLIPVCNFQSRNP